MYTIYEECTRCDYRRPRDIEPSEVEAIRNITLAAVRRGKPCHGCGGREIDLVARDSIGREIYRYSTDVDKIE
jgi:hypothetical protein